MPPPTTAATPTANPVSYESEDDLVAAMKSALRADEALTSHSIAARLSDGAGLLWLECGRKINASSVKTAYRAARAQIAEEDEEALAAAAPPQRTLTQRAVAFAGSEVDPLAMCVVESRVERMESQVAVKQPASFTIVTCDGTGTPCASGGNTVRNRSGRSGSALVIATLL